MSIQAWYEEWKHNENTVRCWIRFTDYCFTVAPGFVHKRLYVFFVGKDLINIFNAHTMALIHFCLKMKHHYLLQQMQYNW